MFLMCPFQHHDDPTIGVHVIDSWTYYVLQYLEGVSQSSKKSLQDFVSLHHYPFPLLYSPGKPFCSQLLQGHFLALQ